MIIALLIVGSQSAIAPGSQRDRPLLSFEELLRRPVGLRPELRGRHPRLFFTADELDLWRERAHTTHRELWQEASQHVRALELEPPPPGSPMLDRSSVEQRPGDLSQYEIAYILAEVSFAYAIERDPRYLDAAKRWLMTVIRYDPWGYTFRTPNVDLPPAHLLYAVALAYDLLYNDLTGPEREAVRAKLARQARLMYDYFRYRPRKRYSYSQNHTFIPMAGLAIAALALMGEEPEAEGWARLARAVYDRVRTTFGVDGYYYEGFHYFVFSLHWIIRYLDAWEHATGEDLYPQWRAKLLPLKYYVAHSILPDGRGIFDFGDAGRGAAERNATQRERLNSGYEVFYRIAAKYKDAESQAVAEWLRRDLRTRTWEPYWAFYSYDPSVRPAAIESLPLAYYFRDSGVVFWRSSWRADAVAFAFKCGPPEGHHVAELLPRLPDWRLNTGHAHPDAGSFIIYAHGRYLTGDTGYTGVKLTSDHNTVLVDGRGQANDGRHEVFKDVPYDRLDQIRIVEVWATPEYFYARGSVAAAYSPELGLARFDRHLLYVAPDYFIVWDELEAHDPHVFTWLLNAEQRIVEESPAVHLLINKDAALLVQRLLPAKAEVQIAPQMVTTQGRPGSVERGAQEQRGVQLIVRSEAARSLEFLHLLWPVKLDALRTRPKASSLDGARGALIVWPDGSREVIALQPTRESVEGVVTDGARAVVSFRQDRWRRLIVHAGTRLALDDKLLLSTSRPATVSLIADGQGGHGVASAAAPFELTLRLAQRPREVRVDGVAVPFEYDSKARTLHLRLERAGRFEWIE